MLLNCTTPNQFKRGFNINSKVNPVENEITGYKVNFPAAHKVNYPVDKEITTVHKVNFPAKIEATSGYSVDYTDCVIQQEAFYLKFKKNSNLSLILTKNQNHNFNCYIISNLNDGKICEDKLCEAMQRYLSLQEECIVVQEKISIERLHLSLDYYNQKFNVNFFVLIEVQPLLELLELLQVENVWPIVYLLNELMLLITQEDDTIENLD
ncbi:hypothetical protein BN7_3275 [Wickerhamomyces ciferrii]|uniref:Uncharacterized protein n=1 Tax=Wickerhamomyces ciferrii (strain ATCC 14091 / BCRC 22168 / CBS 111 / JCM 3599 / NBRC 0793 / NRRL Y-1031 F-60-10) TaxID=1206466 RepID=K0KL52_WICCF|nr:uncharacterized protein BN7_3275 [Wickerhamomyces ciferrii]CCH43721.1 hypothetical protein BN7_3275 [Wickerhamomyces ciferrii]